MSDAERMQTEEPAGLDSYLAMDRSELIGRFVVGIDRLDGRVFELPSDDLDRAWPRDAGVGKWPIRVLLGHLADAEVSFVHRMRRVVAEPGCELGAWDDEAFIDAGHYGVIATSEGGEATRPPIGAAVAVIHTLRGWMGPWLADLPAEAWTKSGMHPERGPMSLKDILAYDTWHLERHAWFCNLKVAKLTGAS